MTEDEIRQVVLVAFPEWIRVLFGCVPLDLLNDKLMVRNLWKSETPSEGIEMIERLTGRQVVLADGPAVQIDVSGEAVSKARSLDASLVQTSMIMGLLSQEIVTIDKVRHYLAAAIAVACLSAGGEFEAYRNGNPLWHPTSKPDDGCWSLNFAASRVRWGPFGVSERVLVPLCSFLRGRKLDIAGLSCVCEGIPEDLAEVDNFVIKFVEVEAAAKD